MRKRRYEILLPAKYNDGRSIQAECMTCFPQTFAEVVSESGALSLDPHLVVGIWFREGKRFDDE